MAADAGSNNSSRCGQKEWQQIWAEMDSSKRGAALTHALIDNTAATKSEHIGWCLANSHGLGGVGFERLSGRRQGEEQEETARHECMLMMM